VWKETITSAFPRAERTTLTPAGSAPSVTSSNCSGADSSSTRCPGLIPSFFGSGVPEYPAMRGA
jgi:hypothetical protein